MSQYDFGTIDPYVVDGVQLASMLNNWRDAVHSWHRGASRPSYIVPGQMWINDAGGATNWIVNVYISPTVGDLPVFTYNTTAGTITVSAAAGGTLAAAILLAQAAASPSVRWNATGNPIDQKNWRTTLTTTGALRFSQYNDAGTEVAYTELPTGGSGSQPMMRMYSETVLASANAEMRVNIPAGAKVVELHFMTGNTASAVDTLIFNALNGAAILNPAGHFTQFHYGSAAAGAASTNTGTSWMFAGSVVNTYGVFRPMYASMFSQVLGSAQGWAINGSTRFSLNNSYDGGSATVPTGYRIANSGAATFVTGSYLRCLAVY